MSVRSILGLSLCLVLCGCARWSGGDYADLDVRLESLAPAGGAAFLFDTAGAIAVLRAGAADIAAARPFSASTRISLGELSEIVVAALVLRLGELGTIDLDRPLGPLAGVIPDSPDSPALRRLGESSPREILAQVTGLRANYAGMQRGYDPERNAGYFLRDAPVLREPGLLRMDSSAPIDILGLVVASRWGGSLEDCAASLLFRPVGMASGSYGPRPGDRRYAGHYKYGLSLPDFQEALAPSTSFVADGRDLVRFFRMLLSGGRLDGRRIMAESSVAAMLGSEVPGPGPARGLPWLLDPPGLEGLGRVCWYQGRWLGHRACVILLPELGLGALALANAWAWDPGAGIYELCAELLTRCARKRFGIRAAAPAEESSPIPPRGLGEGLSGIYASELGPVYLRFEGEGLELGFEGLTSVLVYRGEKDFSGRPGTAVRSLRPRENGSVDLEFASGEMSLGCPRLEALDYPPAWEEWPGLYRREGRDGARPYAFELRRSGRLYLIDGGEGREYVLLPAEEGRARVVASVASAFYGLELGPAGPGRFFLGDTPYRKK